MKKKTAVQNPLVYILLIICLLSVPSILIACTSFVLKRENQVLLAKNLDWDISNGIIMINKKGVLKTAFCDGQRKLSWTSRYGSVTFNQFGKEFPLGGMNEKGLVIEELNSWGRTPGSGNKYQLNEFQWTQFCLDNFADVEELLDGIDSIVIVPLLINLHYLITDSSGNTAIVEFHDGRSYIYNGSSLPHPVLSNNHYENSLDYLGNFRGFGGNMEIRQDRSSNGRFVTVASMLKSLEPSYTIGETAFGILDSVSQADTQWSIVYNITNRVIQFNTRGNRNVRTVDLNDLDFTCETHELFIDFINDDTGEGRCSFKEFSPTDNTQLLVDVFDKYERHNPGELSIDEFLKLAEYGNSIKCNR